MPRFSLRSPRSPRAAPDEDASAQGFDRREKGAPFCEMYQLVRDCETGQHNLIQVLLQHRFELYAFPPGF
jgi:hypothetical protein